MKKGGRPVLALKHVSLFQSDRPTACESPLIPDRDLTTVISAMLYVSAGKRQTKEPKRRGEARKWMAPARHSHRSETIRIIAGVESDGGSAVRLKMFGSDIHILADHAEPTTAIIEGNPRKIERIHDELGVVFETVVCRRGIIVDKNCRMGRSRSDEGDEGQVMS